MSGNQGWRSMEPERKPADEAPRDWRHARRAPARGPGILWKRWLRIGFVSLFVVLLVGTIVWLFRFLGGHDVEFYAASVWQYEDQDLMPINPHAEGDLQVLQSLRDAGDILTQNTAFSELENWDNTGHERDQADVAVVFLNLIAGSDGDGVFLLVKNSSTDRPDSFGRLTDLREHLENIPARRKLLLLDVGHVVVDWRLGIIANRFMDELRSATEDIRNLVVITSCQDGEQSWTSTEIETGGQSVFGHYVMRGLAGDADLDGDDEVRVSELFRYVAGNTSHWVTNNRDVRIGQHPQIIPAIDELESSRDFAVMRASSSSLRGASAADTSPAWERIHGLWRTRTDLEEEHDPVQHDPLRWRVLTHSLLRAEAHLRAGQTESAGELADRASEMASALRGAGGLARDFDEYDFLLDAVASRLIDPNAERTGEWYLEQIQRGHFDALKTDFPGTSFADDARRDNFVALRKQAENAAAAAFSVAPFVTADILDADRVHSAAEDLLFAPGSADESSDASIRDLSLRYTAIVETAEAVRDGRRTLNRILADLPYLARWAADANADSRARGDILELARSEESRCFSRDVSPNLEPGLLRVAEDHDSIESRILSLVILARRLNGVLHGDLVNGRDPEVNVDELATLTRRAGDLHQHDIRGALRSAAGRLASERTESAQADHREQIVRMLRLPFLSSDVRTTLKEQQDSHERNMQGSHEDLSAEEIGSRTASDTVDAVDLPRAEWHGFWVLQTLSLGQDWTDDPRIAERWRGIHGHDGDQSRQYEDAVAVGDFIRQEWGSVADKIGTKTQPVPGGDFAERRARLLDGERLTRSLHPYEAWRLVQGDEDPAALLRSYRLIELCLLQADRQLDGFWMSPKDRLDDPDAAWYARAVEQCLSFCEDRRASARIPEAESEIDARRESLDSRRKARIDIRVAGGDTGIVRFSRSEKNKPVVVAIDDRKDIPAGAPSLWLRHHDRPDVDVETNGLTAGSDDRTPIRFQLNRIDSDAARAAGCSPLDIEPMAFFRGHRWSTDLLTVDPCQERGRFVRYTPAPQTGSVQVIGGDQRPVVFVLDWSESMKETLPDDPDQTKATAAVRTLREILKSMQREARVLQRNDAVGLVVFGHRMTQKKGEQKENPAWKELKGNNAIPGGVDANHDYEALVDISPIGVAAPRIDRELKDLQAAVPAWGITPLVGAMWKAASMLPENGGLIIAISDGAATDVELAQSDLRAKLKPLNVSAFIVGFGFEPGDSLAREWLADLKDMAGDVGCDFLEAPNPDNLKEKINSATQAGSFRLEHVTTRDVREERLESTATDLPAGNYRLTYSPLPAIPVPIRGGEQLTFRLGWPGNRLERVSVATKWKRYATGAETGSSSGQRNPAFDPDVIAHHRWTIDSSGSSRVVVVLDHDDESRQHLPVNRPAEIEFDVHPKDAETTTDVAWRLLPNQTVPAWEFRIADWPGQTPPEIQAIWKMTPTPPDGRVSWKNGLDAAFDSDTAILVGERGPLPEARVTGKLLPGRRLEVELIPPNGSDPNGRIGDIRVQLGRVTASDEFVVWDLPVDIELFPSTGGASHQFQLTDEVDVEALVVGLTSLKSRQNGAFRLVEPLIIPEPDNVDAGN